MYSQDGKYFGFGPVVMELFIFLEIFEKITWIGLEETDTKKQGSFMEIPTERVNVIPLKAIKGSGLVYKAKVLYHYSKWNTLIKNEIKKHAFIHARAPSHTAYITMRLSKQFDSKHFWFKYAGSWVESASKFYEHQRSTLRSLKNHCKVTINGEWPNQPNHVLAFENPCLTVAHREEGKLKLMNKEWKRPFNFCFVGGLNENKGCKLLLEAWQQLDNENLGTLHIVGTGILESTLKNQAKGLKNTVKFFGNIPKDSVHSIYEKCNFIIMASRTEGFPKVVGEAMNYGCIPIVTDISCLGQYIKPYRNGLIINNRDSESIAKALEESLALSKETMSAYAAFNYEMAKTFTYDHYRQRIIQDVFNKN